MIIDANNPAALAAQSIAGQRDSQQQRADSVQQAAVDRAQNSQRARADQASGASAPQTRQSVSAPDTENQRIAEDRAPADRRQSREATAPPQPERPIAPTAPPGAQRGTIVDVYA
jgi:hypothetical protein